MKIGIYGGAFNPIHYGHLRTAEEIYEILSLNKIIFMPSGKTPFDKPDIIKTSHRFEMVKKAIRGNRHFDISDIEANKRGRSYTIDTIKKLIRKYKDCELYFILGMDAFLDMPGWKQPGSLVKLANMVVMSRPGHSFHDLNNSPYLKNLSGKTLRQLDKGDRDAYSFKMSENTKGILCQVTGMDISASLIRNRIKSGRNIRYLLPDSVKSYIISNKLYKK